MKFAYPAIFTPQPAGSFLVEVPDLPGCVSGGGDMAEALFMAGEAAATWLWDAENCKNPIPAPCQSLQAEAPAFVSYIYADTDEYRRKYDSHAVKKTLSIPSWLNEQAIQANVNFSQVLQDALKAKLNLS